MLIGHPRSSVQRSVQSDSLVHFSCGCAEILSRSERIQKSLTNRRQERLTKRCSVRTPQGNAKQGAKTGSECPGGRLARLSCYFLARPENRNRE
jgi:hypothetical protein